MPNTWLITGTSRGFGQGLAKAVLDSGDRLVATARRPEQLVDLVATYGDRVRTFALDVTDADAARAAVAFAVAEFGSLDVVVNNAGYADSAPIEEMTDADFRSQVEANLFGTVNVSKAALPVMREQRSGTIVQFSSLGGRVGGTPGMGAYQSAKFAVEGFSEVLANEVGPLGIRVMIVEPGAFRTDWQGASMKLHDVGPDYAETVGALNAYRAANASNQPGDPARAAAIIVGTVNGDDLPMRLVLGAGAVDMSAPPLPLAPPRRRDGPPSAPRPTFLPGSRRPPLPTPLHLSSFIREEKSTIVNTSASTWIITGASSGLGYDLAEHVLSRGAVALLRLALPGMRARRSGMIVNMSSMDGIASLPGNAFYSASQFALEGLTESLWQEIEPSGLKAILMEPGSFLTAIDSRTHFSGELIPDYDTSSGNFFRAMQNIAELSDVMFPGDPKAAARVIYDQLTSNPTVHCLILGTDAMTRIGVKIDDLQSDYEASRLIAHRTDFVRA